MAGLSLNMGLGGGFGSGYNGAAVPAAAGASAQGPTTIGTKAFGITAGGGMSKVGPAALLSVGGLSLVALVFIWYSLPR